MKTNPQIRTQSPKKIKYQWIKEKMDKCNWSVKDGVKLYRFPNWLLGKVYSKVDMVTSNGRLTRGRIIYHFIPSEYTIDKIPIIVDVEVSLDKIIPDNALFLSYTELKEIFKNNKYSD